MVFPPVAESVFHESEAEKPSPQEFWGHNTHFINREVLLISGDVLGILQGSTARSLVYNSQNLNSVDPLAGVR